MFRKDDAGAVGPGRHRLLGRGLRAARQVPGVYTEVATFAADIKKAAGELG